MHRLKTTLTILVCVWFASCGICVAQKPTIVSIEAMPGEPFGLGKIIFRMPKSDLNVAETGAIRITEEDNRVFYPVSSGGLLGRILGGGQPSPDMRNQVWFLFKGDRELKIKLHCGDTIETAVIPRRPRRPLFANQKWRVWWREYTKAFADSADYPPAFESYLTSMLSKRLGMRPTAKMNRARNPNQLQQTLELIFSVESIRSRIIRDMLLDGVARQKPTLPLPSELRWSDSYITPPLDAPKVENLARHVPRECFYVRFGTWKNQVWLKNLMEEYGGDVSRMVNLRGYEFPGSGNMLDQLGLESSATDDLLGGNFVKDVAFIGTDFYINDGGSIGILFESKGKFFGRNLRSRRKTMARKNKKKGYTLTEFKIGETEATILEAPGNLVRSILVSHENIHLVTNCKYVAKRFLEAAKGNRRLSDSTEFLHARKILPTDRDDTIFLYLSAEFFQNLLSPQYQIELRRRSSLMAEVQMFQMAALVAENEGIADDDIEKWFELDLLPENYGSRADGAEVTYKDGSYFDSIRGKRGFFIPIPDIKIDRISQSESDWYAERAKYYERQLKRIDPIFGAIKRYEMKGNVERLVFDARIAPFGEQKYGFLSRMLGPPTKTEIKLSPKDVVTLQGSLQGGMLFPNVEPHLVFAAIQNDSLPETDLRPKNVLDLLRTLKTTPGYLGAWPKPGYLDILPALGAQPDELGYTYSRLLGLWRLQFDNYSLLSFDRKRLENARGFIKPIETKNDAQFRLTVGDIRESKLVHWVNSLNYQRSWQTSITNVRLMNMLTNQFGVKTENARAMAEEILGVKLVCNLGGPYSLAKTKSGRQIWQSDAWPSFEDPGIPQDYMSSILKWFRGVRFEIKQQKGQFVVYGWVDVERKEKKKAGFKLPSFSGFKGFGKIEELPKSEKKEKLPEQKSKREKKSEKKNSDKKE